MLPTGIMGRSSGFSVDEGTFCDPLSRYCAQTGCRQVMRAAGLLYLSLFELISHLPLRYADFRRLPLALK
jgi:hypothetical protein